MPAREQIFKATALASSDKVLATPFSFFRQETKPLRSCFSNRSIATDFSRTTRCYPIIETNRTNCASFFHLSKNYFNYPIVSFRPFIPRTRRTSDVPSRRASTCLAPLSLSLSLSRSLIPCVAAPQPFADCSSPPSSSDVFLGCR